VPPAASQVFKGVDLQAGGFVAIKQISLSGMSSGDLENITLEIDLLRNLSHQNIVQYLGSYKTKSHLYIILEYVENGSLSQIIKPSRFGAFPESLVAVYIAQVLRGLAYLHQEGVVHRDIKGANILTTKQGIVKLADFGVATRMLETRETAMSEPVVGTPYWMAPEVIEMVGITSASDIWSVGCTAIELLTGYPPYYELQPMPALYRIVQDEIPPLPRNISDAMTDFLLQCFKKDPAQRPSAVELLEHQWLQKSHDTLKTTWRTKRPESLVRSPSEERDGVTQAVEQALTTQEQGVRDREPPFSSHPVSARGPISTPASDESLRSLQRQDSSRYSAASSSNTAKFFGVTSTHKLPKEPANDFLLKWFQERMALVPAQRSDRLRGKDDTITSVDQGLSQVANEDEQRKHRQMTEEIHRLLKMLSARKRDGVILSGCRQLVEHFEKYPEERLRFIHEGGPLALIELLNNLKRASPLATHGALQVVNSLAADKAVIEEELSHTGLVPCVVQFVVPSWLLTIRLEAMKFLHTLCTQSIITQHIFFTCLGVPYLAYALEDVHQISNDPSKSQERIAMARLAVDSVWALIKSGETKTCSISSVCRLLADADLIPYVVKGLALLDGPGEPRYPSKEQLNHGTDSSGSDSTAIVQVAVSPTTYREKVASILLVFACSDSSVKAKFFSTATLSYILATLKSTRAHVLCILLTTLKQISHEPDALDPLMNAGAMTAVVPFLTEGTGLLAQIQNSEVLQIVDALCKLDKGRQEAAAAAGLVPHLCRFAAQRAAPRPGERGGTGSIRKLALPMLLAMAHAGRRAKQELWKHGAVDTFFALLGEKLWQVPALDALSAWTITDGRVEQFLLQPEKLEALLRLLRTEDNMVCLLQPLTNACSRSPRINIALAGAGLLKLIFARFGHPDAAVRLTLLRLLRSVYEQAPNPKQMVATHDMMGHLANLANGGDHHGRTQMVLVKKSAQNLLNAVHVNTVL